MSGVCREATSTLYVRAIADTPKKIKKIKKNTHKPLPSCQKKCILQL